MPISTRPPPPSSSTMPSDQMDKRINQSRILVVVLFALIALLWRSLSMDLGTEIGHSIRPPPTPREENIDDPSTWAKENWPDLEPGASPPETNAGERDMAPPPGTSLATDMITTSFTLVPANDRRLVKSPGVPEGSHQWHGSFPINSPLDLPRIFPRLDDKLQERNNSTSPIRVCVFNRVPRQRSLWTSNVLSMFGSGRFQYVSIEATDCQFYGKCDSQMTRKHILCNDKVSPTVGLVEWVKCCFHDRFEQVMKVQRWDVAVATGDEYCASIVKTYGRAHFRFYYTKAPMAGARFLPLGPREEFRRVKPQHVVLVKDKKFLFNFVGSITSPSRKVLADVLAQQKSAWGDKPASSFVQHQE